MIILFSISFLANFSSFNSYLYEKNISYTYDFYLKEDIVAVNMYANKNFIGIKSVMILQDMIKNNVSENLRGIMTKEVIASSQKQQAYLTQGIVPKIELPLKLPSGVKNIIGEGGEINVDGYQSIMIKLERSTSSLANLASEGSQNSLWNQLQPQLETELNLKISGTVGQKIHVYVDHNSKRESDYNNKVKLWYQGDEDDIFQYIKAGNIENVPGVSGAEKKGLFGIHTRGKIGSVDFDVVTARIQSRTASDSFVGNTTFNVDTIYDGDFIKDKYFLLGIDPRDSLMDLKVYKEVNYSTSAIPAVCYYDPKNGAPVDSGKFEQQIIGQDYNRLYFITSNNNIVYYIEMKQSMYNLPYMLAVTYIYKDHITGKEDTVGTYIPPEQGTLKLKLIRTEYPSYGDPTWDLSLKNIYSFGGGGAKNVDVEIHRDEPNTNEDPTGEVIQGDTVFYMNLLGLDKDGIVGIDANQVDREKGIIIFPDLEPFINPNLSTPDSIYNKTVINYEQGEGRKYYIVVRYSSPKTFYYLQAPIVDSSEVIIVENNNQIDTLKRGHDYTIDYNSGALQFISIDKIASPDAKLRIKWDMVPLLSYTSRYITMLTTNSKPLPNTDLKTSISFSTSSTREERPKFGEEPNSIFISNITGGSNFDVAPLNFLARILPFVNNTPSKLKFGGNIAFSIPNINSKGKGYIDDMESSTNSFRIEGNSRAMWQLSSTPVNENSDSVAAQFHWFISNELTSNINPNLPEADMYSKNSVLNLYFLPEDSSPASWGGISTFLSDQGWDISDKEFLEVWVQGDTGQLFIDLASYLAEDAPRRNKEGKIVGLGKFETEDNVNPDGMLDSLEDTGLDGVFGSDGEWTASSKDDGNDDYLKKNQDINTLDDTLKLNGTEKNKVLDSEDLDNNGKEETKNSYYEYCIDLSSDSLVRLQGKNGWKMYRIPLLDPKYHITYYDTPDSIRPDSTRIRIARIWTKGVSHLNRIKLYKIEISGAKWLNKGIFNLQNLPDTTDTTMKFSILFRGNYTDSLYSQYLPFNPGRNIYGKEKEEHSLALNIKNLKKGYYSYTYQYFPTRMDFRLYKAFSFYVKKAYPLNDSLEFFVRIMTDTADYYQYSVRLTPGDSTWKHPEIYFDKFFDIKIRGDTISSDGMYYIKGNPTLQQVQWIGAGIINRGINSATNEVWFDECALIYPNNNRGINTSVSLSTNLGDFSAFTFSFSNNTPFFKQNITDLRGVGGNSQIKYNSKLTITGDKLLFNLFSLPIVYSIGKGKSAPYYYSNSDIVLPDSLMPKNTAHSENTSISMGISRKNTSKNPLLAYSIDRMHFSSMKSFSTSFDPNAKIDSTYGENASFSYNTPFPLVSIPLPFKQKWKVFPENMSFSETYHSSQKSLYEKMDSVFVKKPQNPVKSLNGNFSFRYSPLRLFSVSYNSSSNRDIRKGWRNGGIEEAYRENGKLRTGLGILNIINNTFDYSFSYNENHSEQYRISLGDTIGDVRGISMRHSAVAGIQIKTAKIIAFLPSLRDETKDKAAPAMSMQWILAKIDDFGSHLGDLQLNAQYERQSNFAYIKWRPTIQNRIWFQDSFPVKRFPVPNDGFVRSLSLSGSESFSLSPVSLHTSYRWSKTIPNPNLNQPIKQSITFPNFSISISSVEKILHLNKIIKSLNLSLNVNRDSTATIYTSGGNKQETSVSWSYSPTSQIGFPKKINLTVNGNYKDEIGHSSADLQSSSENKHWSIGASSNYSFSAPTGINLPFLKNRIKFSSNLNLKFSLNQSSDYKVQKTIPLDTTETKERVNVKSHTKITLFKLSGDYQFSPSVNGEISIEDNHTIDLKKNNTFDSFSLAFKAIFKF